MIEKEVFSWRIPLLSTLTDVTKGCWDTHRVCTGDPVSLTLMWNMFDFDIAFCLCHI